MANHVDYVHASLFGLTTLITNTSLRWNAKITNWEINKKQQSSKTKSEKMIRPKQ